MKKNKLLIGCLSITMLSNAQNKIDTSAAVNAQYVLIWNSKDSSNPNTSNFKFTKQDETNELDIVLKKDSIGKWLYTNQAKDKLQEYFGLTYPLDSSIFNDANTMAEWMEGQKAKVIYLSTNRNQADNKTFDWWWLIVTSIGGITIGFLINKWIQSNMSKEEGKYGAIQFKSDIQKLFNEDNKENKKLDFKQILEYVQQIRSQKNAQEELINIKDTDAERANQKSETYLTKIGSIQQDLTNTALKLEQDQAYHKAMATQYIEAFNTRFSGGLAQHPIPLSDKAFFTKTIYSIAFHYLSFEKSMSQRADSHDLKNIATILQNIQQQPNEVLKLNEENDITKYSGLLIFIAEELKRNGIEKLENVNFRGYNFGE
jgi:hypothetical protein